jgi:choline-glycine betaine transporter
MRLLRALGAGVMCFATGAGLSILFGLPSQQWIRAGVICSSVVAIFVFMKPPRVPQ